MESDTETASVANTMAGTHLTDPSKSKPKKKTGVRRKNHRGEKKKSAQTDTPTLTANPSADFAIFNHQPLEASSSTVSNFAINHNNGNNDSNTLPLFEIRPTPHAGLGLFATSPIPRGTSILSEPPLLALRPSETDPSSIHTAFLALPAAAQATIIGLDAVEDADSGPFRTHIAELAAQREERGTPDLQAALLIALEEFKVISVFRTNAFNMRAEPEGEGEGDREADKEADEPAVGLFPIAARLNHSCLPNAHVTFNQRIGQLTVHATRDVLPAEEITFPYLGTMSFYMPRERWQEGLRRWGFECACAACGGGEEGERHERRRAMLLRNQLLLQRFRKGRGEDVGRALGWALELVVGLEEEGAGKEVARA
jgi:SET domain